MDADIEKRLDRIDDKLDKVYELQIETAQQETRIGALEKAIDEMKSSFPAQIDEIKKQLENQSKAAGNRALKWWEYVGAGVITLLLGYIAVKIGLK